uniref:Wsv440-like protein n=1 Tax=Sesarmops intermedium nimavirus TaxID=2133796 RepID=A0A401IPR1_9VIRU|nr:MAG: wsv440-like protein [Sesarmops intermedium nimavirus]GBG35603.1 wsv440-like protein [Sesarmops intermedium nimavirus]
MTIDLNTAENLVRWYNELACGCPLATRVNRVIGSMGGGVDAAAVRSRPNLEKGEKKKIPQRVSNLIEGILLQRALCRPDLAAAAFDMSDRLHYCACNSIRGNFNLSSMTAWEPTSSKEATTIKVTCPYCTIEYGGKYSSSTTVRPIPLMTLFRRKTEQEIVPERTETKKLYTALLSASDGCYQQTSFNGSWTCLIFGKSPSTTIEAEVLVSNKVSHTVRLQPVCVCADLLYAICSTTGRSEFAFQARNMSVIEGGEFLYFKYTLFEEGGPFDSKVDMKELVNTEPTLETGCLMAAVSNITTYSSSSPSSSSTEEEELQPPPPPPAKKIKTTDDREKKMSTTNEVDTQSLLLTILSNNRKGNNKRKRIIKNVKLPVEVSSIKDSEKFDTCKTEYILPCPQIEEQTVSDYQRQIYMSYNNKVIKHPVEINGTEFNVCVRSFKKKYIMPPSHTLFSPPLIIRTSYNRYKIISGAPAFFDRVELEDGVTLDSNAAHCAILRLLSYIRENSLKRSVEVASGKNFNVIIKTPTTNIGVPISTKEIRDRQLCTATTLGMLAGLAK